ncbi:MAG: carboxypeptidase [Flavobacteriaceae bacterium]|nr:carboxypeptidase [Flavobacteriaceae bacterium]
MKKIFFVLAFSLTTSGLLAQRTLVEDTKVITNHTLNTGTSQWAYTAETGTQPVWDSQGKSIANLHYTYYTRDGIKDRKNRPLVISFNGGPGSASVWMHLAYTGPRVLNIDDEGYPVQPYGFSHNPYTILDVADIVYVNPVNTGYSRTIPEDGSEVDRKKFFGVNADIAYLAEWLNTFVQRHQRWESPKYLIGESYGTTRVSGLAYALQNNQWMYLNGVILVSPTELGIDREGPVEIANRIPYFAAAAWYHKQLDQSYQSMKLTDYLAEVESFSINQLLPVLVKGGFASDGEKNAMAEQMQRYTSIDAQVYRQHNLEVPFPYFWKELLRDQGYTVGRLDSRYLGLDKKEAGDAPDYAAELTSWLHSFTPAINAYMHQELNWKTDVKYNMFGPVNPWDRSNDQTGAQLRQAMAQNPYLNVMFQSGYFDGATTYFNAKYSMWQLDPSGKMKDRISFKGYESGHMMYLRRADLKTANEDIRSFIKASSSQGKSAQYSLKP